MNGQVGCQPGEGMVSPQLTECRTSPNLGISNHLSGAYGLQLQGLLHQRGDTICVLLRPSVRLISMLSLWHGR